MPRHQAGSERRRTVAPDAAQREAFRAHDGHTLAFTDALREGRCRGEGRLAQDVGANVAALRPLVGPWSLEILFLLHVEGPRRFGALRRGLGGVSSRVLTDKLRLLEREGHVRREEAERAVTYALTERGATVARHLHPIVFYLRNADGLAGPAPAPVARRNG